DEVYGTPDFERKVALLKRTEAIAKHLTDFLNKTDRFAKTIVFCVDQEHASDMRTALNNLSSDLVRQYPDYVCRVTADEGDIGRGHLSRFQDVETKTPVILTTSQLLTTGVDAPTCKNIVLARVVGSMTDFKQIIGRGTRVRDDYGKLFFNILDYTGSATRLFAGPAFDGDPALATVQAIDLDGSTVEGSTAIEHPEEPIPDGGPAAGQPEADPFDLLCHLAYNAPLRTRRERAERLRKEKKDFFDRYAPAARAVLNELLEKYAEHGTAQFVLPDVLGVPPLSEHGNV